MSLGTDHVGNVDGEIAPSARRYLRCNFLGDRWTIIDCPGSIEFAQQSLDALVCADVAVLVVEAKPDNEITAMPFIRMIADTGIPAILFINKMDQLEGSISDIVETYRMVFSRPLLFRQLPFTEGDAVAGAVDLISNRAFRYREGEPSEVIPIPDSIVEEAESARQTLLEDLADFDDDLLERLLEDEEPTTDDVFKTGTESFAAAFFSPALVGAAEYGHGVTRVFKAVRHDVPSFEQTAERHGLGSDGDFVATITDTRYLQHVGRTNVIRIWRGELDAAKSVGGQRVAGLAFYDGTGASKLEQAEAGDVVALTRSESMRTGSVVNHGEVLEGETPRGWRSLDPVLAYSFRVSKRDDDAKLSTMLKRVAEEDASIAIGDSSDGGIAVYGQGDMHLRDVVHRLEKDFGLAVETGPVGVSWRETISKTVDVHARHKKQTGGAGQFADVKVKVVPLPRGAGFKFESEIAGGVVPRQYVPAVEAGLEAALECGPLGFPVVDVKATLYDGQHHSVDSSEMAFKIAGRIAMSDALSNGQSVLLEPIHRVWFETPSAFTSKLNAIISGRRGRILGFDALKGAPGWDEVSAMMPEVALSDIILELRAVSQGAARYRHNYDHYQELYAREAEIVIERRRQELDRN